jgi:hypothetical protein
MGWQRLPGRPGRRRHPDRRPPDGPGRRLRCPDLQAHLQTRFSFDEACRIIVEARAPISIRMSSTPSFSVTTASRPSPASTLNKPCAACHPPEPSTAEAARPPPAHAHHRPIPLGKIMTREVRSLPPRATLLDAAKMMADEHISSLLVVADGKPLGILTETNIVRSLHARHPGDTPVEAIMSSPLITAPGHGPEQRPPSGRGKGHPSPGGHR